MLVETPTAVQVLGALTIAMALHTGILQCSLFDAEADGDGSTVSAYSAPRLLAER